ncbi:bacterio-opsin activator HTH domain-containing protein [Halococcus saccharolyticus DSM 5350]|uniref:Bacterio-opsin activator HTH domain-containing protein n=2 Tax=Halococcus saccharolyticus TaxID=62319 RepID=M0ML04_9EURY|nr:bacterio-opsin activator HTH domain-containing protein [Halococcus saccharolyticus DSM 5350]
MKAVSGSESADDRRDSFEEPVDQRLQGFYEIPREIDMEGLAAEFDISDQSVSERLRRGHRNFVRNGLGWGSLGDEDSTD